MSAVAQVVGEIYSWVSASASAAVRRVFTSNRPCIDPESQVRASPVVNTSQAARLSTLALGQVIQRQTPEVQPAVHVDLAGAALSGCVAGSGELRLEDVPALRRLEPGLKQAAVTQETLKRAESYLRHLPAAAYSSIPLNQLAVGCVILAHKFEDDHAFNNQRWDSLLREASPTPPGKLNLPLLESQICEYLGHVFTFPATPVDEYRDWATVINFLYPNEDRTLDLTLRLPRPTDRPLPKLEVNLHRDVDLNPWAASDGEKGTSAGRRSTATSALPHATFAAGSRFQEGSDGAGWVGGPEG
jgi:hypothetical protein